MVLNIGPQHPATHGVLRCAVKLDGNYSSLIVTGRGGVPARARNGQDPLGLHTPQGEPR